ncbi:uL14 family ribosomal protein, partial [Candidatus Woesearchaeota archaeon]|nr:uL14 family ribosomal protein [Candidatus Woesearchaeota archaeon]
GKPDMRKQVVFAVIVRQKKEYRRPNGMRVKFEDNAAVVLKDDKGNPKGTIFKGAIAKEVCERWPAIAKVANIIA